MLEKYRKKGLYDKHVAMSNEEIKNLTEKIEEETKEKVAPKKNKK